MNQFFFPRQENYTLFSYLTMVFEQAASEEKKLLERFSKDVEYEMTWIAQELWTSSFVKKWAKQLLEAMEKYDTVTIDAIIEDVESFVSRSYNVRENSSNGVRNEVSTWKFIAHMDMLKTLKSVSKYIV